MNCRVIAAFVVAGCWSGLVSAVAASDGISDGITVLPPRVTLDHVDAVGRVAAYACDGDRVGRVVDDVRWEVSDPEVCELVDGVLRPRSDGETRVTATSPSGAIDSVTVTVVGTGDSHVWNFRNDVQSVLARRGCNMGACHGALAGKGGFRLSLRGYDHRFDHHSITRDALGRRVEPTDPGRSLLLTKPTGAVSHKGGVRLNIDDRDYEVLSRWIAAGSPGPSDDDAALIELKVWPSQATQPVGTSSRVLVDAVYDDGRTVDVTHWAKFDATDTSVAAVDEDGGVVIHGPGEAAVSVWFGSKVALARFTVPYGVDERSDEPVMDVAEAEDDAGSDAEPTRGFIDRLVDRQLATLNLTAAPTCDDATFLRRATIDTIGRLPTAEQRQRYLADPPEYRRTNLVERLLSSEEFVDYWAYRLSDVMLITGKRLRPDAVKSYYGWLRDSIAEGRTWDAIVRDVLTARGSSVDNGATNFYALHQSPEDMTENACQAFLGLSIGCAKCHNHPLEKWTNDQYYALANMFSRVRAKGWGGDPRNGDGHRQVLVSTTGDLIQPARGVPQAPAALDQPPIDLDDPGDRREALADWMTGVDNPYFARAITNRVWANFFGRGLVEPVDDLRLSNPATNEPLLDAAARYTAANDFDLRVLMRAILTSDTYARSSVADDRNSSDDRYLSRYYPRRMMAEVLLDAIDQVLDTSTDYTHVLYSGADRQETDFYDDGTRAIELFDSAVESYFLKTFGRNEREITCECERDDEPSMVQALHLSNGETLNPKLDADDSFPSRCAADGVPPAEYVGRLFTRALNREPSDDERQRLVNLIEGAGEDADARAVAYRDAAWGVLTSVEFVFNH